MDRHLSSEIDAIRARMMSSPFRGTYNSYSFPHTIVRYGCIAANLGVFLAWQFALRKPPLDDHFWSWLDRKYKPGFYLKVRAFLERNFLYRLGDEETRPWTLLTSAFSHMDSAHIGANLIGFNAFYRNLAIALSPVMMIGLIASTAVAGDIGFRIQQAKYKFPNRHVRALGLSGVTSGMGVAATMLFPHSTATLYGVSMPLWAATAAYFAWDVFFLSSTSSTIGHSAHVGGAVMGAAYVLLLKQFNLVNVLRWPL